MNPKVKAYVLEQKPYPERDAVLPFDALRSLNIRKLERRIQRANSKVSDMKDWDGNTHTFHGGHSQGYWTAKEVSLIEMQDSMREFITPHLRDAVEALVLNYETTEAWAYNPFEAKHILAMFDVIGDNEFETNLWAQYQLQAGYVVLPTELETLRYEGE